MASSRSSLSTDGGEETSSSDSSSESSSAAHNPGTPVAALSPPHRRVPWVASEVRDEEAGEGTTDGASDTPDESEETSSASASEGEHVDTRYLYGFCHACGIVEVPVPDGYISRSRVPAQCGGCRGSVVLSDSKILLGNVAKAAREATPPPDDGRRVCNIGSGEIVPAGVVLAGSLGALLFVVYWVIVYAESSFETPEVGVLVLTMVLTCAIPFLCAAVWACVGIGMRSWGMIGAFAFCCMLGWVLVLSLLIFGVALGMRCEEYDEDSTDRAACEQFLTIYVVTIVVLAVCCIVYLVAAVWEMKNFWETRSS
jgi:hypothetical protein